MQMDTEARAWLDTTVKRILARHTLRDAERAGITYEIMSHLHAAGEARATAQGRTEVTREDLQHALSEAGGEAGLAAAFVQPLSRPRERAPLGRRFAALAIDGFLVLMGLIALHTMLEILLGMVPGMMRRSAAPMDEPSFLLPWGYHDGTLPALTQTIFYAMSALLVLGYFAWFEAHEGRTLGKRAMELRVVRMDGEPVTMREAVIRNLSKLSPPLFLLDVVIGLIAFSADRQRVLDKVAETMVVKA